MRFSECEVQFMRDSYGKISVNKIANELNRSYSSITSKAYSMGITSSLYRDLAGNRFGRLLVIKKLNKIGKYGNCIWLCLCDCGSEYEVRTASLTSGNTRSCGCFLSDAHKCSPANMLDLTNERFDRLTALYPTDKRSGSFVVWRCICNCGNYHDVPTGYLTSRKTKSCGCLNIEKRIENLPDDYSGENHWNWKGGITPDVLALRNSSKYKAWRDAIFIRDDYRCQKCNKKGYLHAHHILSFAEYDYLRYDIDNGITFCSKCHGIFHHKYKEYDAEGLEEFLYE